MTISFTTSEEFTHLPERDQSQLLTAAEEFNSHPDNLDWAIRRAKAGASDLSASTRLRTSIYNVLGSLLGADQHLVHHLRFNLPQGLYLEVQNES